MTTIASSAPRGKVSANKLAGFVIWAIGCWMTYAFLDQVTDWGGATSLFAAVAGQFLLTKGQSPVWRGDFSVIPVAFLAADAVINFGGCMAVLANIDQAGSVKALAATFVAYEGTWPMPVKGVLALFVASIVAGTPEYFWNRG